MFRIDTPNPSNNKNKDELAGTIIINDFKEKILIPVDYWSIEDYKTQWLSALKQIIHAKSNIAIPLVTEMYNPASPKFAIMCWVLYRIEDHIYVRNTWIPYDELPRPFIVEDLYRCFSMSDRKKQEDLDHPSEWVIKLSSIKAFYQELVDQMPSSKTSKVFTNYPK